ncbi:MAG: ABC transporter ATP-binding protein [Bacteroides sp.]|nr:ABC transporter ATP-binding protein [Eubacterium sp.]MCM1418123.1 ABC transporter ATP-binding protein [Roseburia sp.]MCM1462253.1 ABC transporter ATP-binding protein [Bacteroides sp.]
MRVAIAANGVIKSFGEKTVLDGIDLTVGKGAIFGLLGPSGAGKTTLIKILTGQLPRDGGSVEINGISVDRLTGEDHKKFGIMMDSFGLYDRLNCYDNLKIFAEIYGVKKEEILRALKKVGLEGAQKTPAARLSKGMRSRLRLARAFMIDPDILFLDEPTSGLDPATADEIHKMMLAEKGRGKTIFLTTHTMTEAEKLCGELVMLNEGKIIERGSPREICGKYDHRRSLKIHLTAGSELRLAHDERAAETVAELIKSGRAETIHTTEPDLETVFMEITGKELTV